MSDKLNRRTPDPIGKVICELFLSWEEMRRQKEDADGADLTRGPAPSADDNSTTKAAEHEQL